MYVSPCSTRYSIHMEYMQLVLDDVPSQPSYYTCTRVYHACSQRPATPCQVSSQLNAIYLDYCATHPDFSGQVSLFAHSLGSVICFDLISHQHLAQHRGVDSQPSAADAPSPRARASPEVGDTSRRSGARGDARGEGAGPFALRWPPLAFDACNLFMLGSPLAMFLRLREATGERDEVLRACAAVCSVCNVCNVCTVSTPHTTPRTPPSPLAIAAQVWPAPCRLFNIFHPADPVTFLIEPALMRTPLAPAPEIDGDEQFAPCAPLPGGGGGGNGARAGGSGGGDAAAEAAGEPSTAGDASPRTSAATEVAAAVAAAKAGAASRFALHEVHRGHGRHYACTAPAPRLHRACTTFAPRLHHFCTAPAPPLHRRAAPSAGAPRGTAATADGRFGCGAGQSSPRRCARCRARGGDGHRRERNGTERSGHRGLLRRSSDEQWSGVRKRRRCGLWRGAQRA